VNLSRVTRAHREATKAAAAAKGARYALGVQLLAAQADGHSVRELAALLDVQPTSVQRWIAAAKDGEPWEA